MTERTRMTIWSFGAVLAGVSGGLVSNQRFWGGWLLIPSWILLAIAWWKG
jgi:hypothetical protein